MRTEAHRGAKDGNGMADYTLTQREYRNEKSKLTRAQRAGDPQKVLAVARAALALFEEKGFPDGWYRWQRAMEDAQLELERRAWRGQRWRL